MDFLANALERQYGAILQMPYVEERADKLSKENEHLKEQLRQLREYVIELEKDVDRDPLVPVFNRRAFMRELTRARSVLDRYGIPSSVIYMDLDDFKSVNDKHGHCTGDALLKRVGEIIKAATRECDMVARLGGDEFAVLMFKSHPQEAHKKAKQLERRISEIEIGTVRGVVNATVSWGVATCTMSDSAEDILSLADQEMYVSKKLSKQTVPA